MKSYIYILSIILLASCLEPFDIETDQIDPKIVIEGLVTDNYQHHYVKVSKSVDFNLGGQTPAVENAQVRISDSQGTVFNFMHNPGQQPDSAGYYISEVKFSGVVGIEYLLEVTVDGITYTARDEMFPALPIDSVSYRLETNPDKGTVIDYYEFLLYAKEPQETKDYYLFEFFENGELLNADNEDVFVADDEALAGEINGLEAPFEYELGDTASVDVFSLSRQVFLFYFDLTNVLQNDGGMFSPPAANPRTNLTNGAMGVFQVSATTTESAIIK